MKIHAFTKNKAVKKKKKPAEKPDKEPKPKEDEAEDTRFAINHLRIAGVKLTLRHRKLEEGVKDVTLPDIDLKNVGGADGITGPEISLKIVEEITKEGLKQTLKAEAQKQAGKLLQKGLEKLQESNSDP